MLIRQSNNKLSRPTAN